MIDVFADTADLAAIRRIPDVAGFTTNPTIMRRAGVTDYEEFARTLISAVGNRPVSLEVIADDHEEITRQAFRISEWGQNVYVKVPITTSTGEPLTDIIHVLSRGVQVNVTAVFTPEQVREVADALAGGRPSFVSVFAGRIADNGQDPVPVVQRAVRIVEAFCKDTRIIWASPREALNVQQAEAVGCHAITLTPELLAKLRAPRRSMEAVSLDTVRMFRRDAVAAGYRL